MESPGGGGGGGGEDGRRVDSPVVGLKTSWVVYHSVRYSHCG